MKPSPGSTAAPLRAFVTILLASAQIAGATLGVSTPKAGAANPAVIDGSSVAGSQTASSATVAVYLSDVIGRDWAAGVNAFAPTPNAANTVSFATSASTANPAVYNTWQSASTANNEPARLIGYYNGGRDNGGPVSQPGVPPTGCPLGSTELNNPFVAMFPGDPAYVTGDPTSSLVSVSPRLPITSAIPRSQQSYFIGAVPAAPIGLDVEASGAPMQAGSLNPTKGIGMRTPSALSFNLTGAYDSFRATVKVDDSATNAYLMTGGCAGTVLFRVYVDNVLLWESGVMTPGTAARSFSVPVIGAQFLRLETLGLFDGYYEDRADWIDAQLDYQSEGGAVSGSVFRDYNSNGVRDLAATPDNMQVDRGLRNIIVTLYGDNDAVLSSVRTNAAGVYRLTAPSEMLGKPLRIEFTNLAERFYTPSYAGPDEDLATHAGSTVQFLTLNPNKPVASINLALMRGNEFCNNNPTIASSCYSAGNPLSPTAPSQDGLAMVNFPFYFAGDESAATQGTDRTFAGLSGEGTGKTLARSTQIGAAYGMAYRKTSNMLFASAAVKRHAGLGRLGVSGIYSVSLFADGSVNEVAPFLQLSTLGIDFGTAPSNADRGLKGLQTLPDDSLSVDTWGYTATGKVGIGDIDIGQNEDFLYVSNLHDRHVYAIRIADTPFGKLRLPRGPQDVLKFANPATRITCLDGSPPRVWGLHLRAGRLYAGYTCTAEVSGALMASNTITRPSDLPPNYDLRNRDAWKNTPFGNAYEALQVHVLETLVDTATPSLAWTSTFSTSIGNYSQGCAFVNSGQAVPVTFEGCTFNPWRDDFDPVRFSYPGKTGWFVYPQPILSDIAFDDDDAMIMNFMDRWGNQIGALNLPPGPPALAEGAIEGVINGAVKGEMLRVCSVGGVLRLEQYGTCALDANGQPLPSAIPNGFDRPNTRVPKTRDYNVYNRLPYVPAHAVGVDYLGNYGFSPGNEFLPVNTAFPVTQALGNHQGPGGSEFYYADYLEKIVIDGAGTRSSENFHDETTSGGSVFVPGMTEIAVATMDPFNEDSSGVSWFNNRDGSNPRDLQIKRFDTTRREDFSKLNTIGDLEALCTSAPVELGNRVWHDMNGNGLQDPSEPPIADVQVSLYHISVVDGAPAFGPTLIATTTTNGRGQYYFSSRYDDRSDTTKRAMFIRGARTLDLGNFGPDGAPNTPDDLALPGLKPSNGGVTNTYLVRIDIPANFERGGALFGMKLTRSNAPFADPRDGVKRSQTSNDAQYDMRDSDAVPTVFAGAGNLSREAGTMTHTIGLPGDSNHSLDAGFFGPPGFGNFVWEDVNHNGMQDADEAGVANVPVALFENGVPLRSMVTSASGEYSFTNLIPTQFYSVQIAAPPGYLFTLQNVGSPDGDSNAQPSGATQAITLTSQEFNPTIDAGIWRPASLGDRVWFDSNRDGRQDASEQGVSGATVRLSSNGVLVASTTTDATGNYQFTGLIPGTSYFVCVVAPTNRGFTKQFSGDGVGDSNVHDTTGCAPGVTLKSGEHNPTIDAGLVISNPRSSTAVELVHFEALRWHDGSAVLTWRTASEINSRGFYVLRAQGSWQGAPPATAAVMGKSLIDATGGQTRSAAYRIVDAQPRAAESTYWLVEVELDGRENVYGPATRRNATAVFMPFAQGP